MRWSSLLTLGGLCAVAPADGLVGTQRPSVSSATRRHHHPTIATGTRRRLGMVLNDAESPVAEALPSSSTPSPPPSSPPAAPDRTEVMARRFEGAWRYGLAGEAMFERMVSPNAEWKAYNGEGGRGAKGVAERLKGMGEFYIDPTFSVTKVTPSGSGGGAGAEAWAVDWMFSGTWPLPWRPRVRVSGVARVETTDEGEIIRRVEDTWTAPKSLGAIVSSQLQPRFFDLLNIFNSPHAEFPEQAVVEKCNGYIIRETPPQVVLRLSMELDPSEPEMLQGYFLPNLAFTGQLKLKGKKPDELVAMSPLSVQVESVESEVFGSTKRVTWTVPVPSQFGLDAAATLPPIVSLDSREEAELYPSPRAGASASVEYVLEPATRVAVAPFGTEDTIGDEANQARKALFAALKRDGRNVVKSAASGRPVFKLHENTVKLVWTTTGKFGMAVYTSQPSFLKPHEISAELE